MLVPLQMAEGFVGDRQTVLFGFWTLMRRPGWLSPAPKKKPALYAQAVHPSKGSIMDESLGTSMFQRGSLIISPGIGFYCDPDHISRFDLATGSFSAIGCSVTTPEIPLLAGEQMSSL
jgi:hypothetical protein